MNKMLITTAGLAEIVNAEQSGTAPVVLSHVALGTGQYTATADMTALKSEFKRMDAVAGGAIADNIIHLTVHDNSSDAYTVNEIGVFTESGTLFAVVSQTTPIAEKSATSEIMFAIDIAVNDIDTASITIGDTNLVLNPATTDAAGVIELATDDEAIAGTDTTRAITPASAKAAMDNQNFVKNLSTASSSLSILGYPTEGSANVNIGVKSFTDSSCGVAVGHGAGPWENATNSTCVGYFAQSKGTKGIALGYRSYTDGGIAIGDHNIGSTDGVGARGGAIVIGNSAGSSGLEAMSIGTKSKSTKAQAVAIGYNATASGLESIALGDSATASGDSAVAIGDASGASGLDSIALGDSATASGYQTTAIGALAKATVQHAIQLGNGTNSTEYTLQVWGYKLLDKTTGKIPAERMPDTYLPTSGGAMTATKAITRDVNDSYLGLHGGTGTDNDGAQLDLCGSAHSSMPGVFQLHARNGDLDKILRGQTDGKLTWDGKYVLNNSFSMPSNASGVVINGGTDYESGAYMRVYGKEHTQYPGCFTLGASDGTNTSALRGLPDGTLTWGGSPIVVLVESQAPTADNGYTWYRKYSDGWVEQGGLVDKAAGTTNVSVTFPVAYSTNPTVSITKSIDTATTEQNSIVVRTVSLTGFTMNKLTTNNYVYWQASGMAAQ